MKRCTPDPQRRQQVTKQFGATPLFRNISLTVEDGDRIGLIGPNGAGKSTLLALHAGQVEPDSGELAVRKRARAAYVPQNSQGAPRLTIRQVLEQALANAARQRSIERARPSARTVGSCWPLRISRAQGGIPLRGHGASGPRDCRGSTGWRNLEVECCSMSLPITSISAARRHRVARRAARQFLFRGCDREP